MLGLLIVALFAFASAEVSREGACPDLKPVENFNLTTYQGTWYEISKFFTDSEKDGKCASADYILNGDGVTVTNFHVVNGVKSSVGGTAKLANAANKPGIITISLKFGKIIRDVTKYIIATDYSNYGISYICNYYEKNNTHQDFLWVLSRTKKLEGDARAAVDSFLKSHSGLIDATRLIDSDLSEDACKFTSTYVISTPTRP